MASMSISRAIGSPTVVVPITLNFDVNNAVEVRYGATLQEAMLSTWKPYASQIFTYGRGDEPSANPLDYYAQVKLANNTILTFHSFEPERLPGTPTYPSSSINTNFSTWHNFWASYGYAPDNPVNTFFALTHENGRVWADDSRWGVDTPETPDTVLFATNYVNWVTKGAENTINMTGYTLAVDFDFSDIDMKGGKVDFWVIAQDDNGHGRYHLFDAPMQDGHNSLALNFNDFENSWLNDNRVINSVDLDPTRIEAWGFGFSGFSSEPLGKIYFDNFAFGHTFYGTSNNDSLSGTDAMDTFYGFSGNDKFWGYAENDLFFGQGGADIFTGGFGEDTVAYTQSKSAIDVHLDPHFTNSSGDAAGDLFGSIENVIGSPFSDRIAGDNAANKLYGQEGHDLLWGYGGDDFLTGNGGADVFTGGLGRDTAVYNGANAAITVNLASEGTRGDANGDEYGSIENVIGSQFADIINGDNGDNFLYGQNGNDIISGGMGADKLYGENGKDTLIGNSGMDTLTGGAGDDIFSFLNYTDSTPANFDTITDFMQGDLIDVSAIDANSVVSGNQAFTYINGNFTSTPGELRVETSGSNYIIQADVNGDAVADLEIHSVNLVNQDDFLL